MGEVTAGCRSVHASATCAGVRFICCAISLTTAAIARLRSLKRPVATLICLRESGAVKPFGAAARSCVWYLRSEEHTSELQSLMRISYAVFCLKNKKNNNSQDE